MQTDIAEKIEAIDWSIIREKMHQHGYAILSDFLEDSRCEALKADYADSTLYRKTVVMERHRFGLREYKYFNYPLPPLIQAIRTGMYPHLVPIANAWFTALKMGVRFPSSHHELLRHCTERGQSKATVLILSYGKGGFNTLHQDLYGEVYFSIQIVLFLDQPEQDYTGGEFVLTQQMPRAQSKAIVLKPNKGEVLIFTTQFKPEQGSRGYYRVNMKHGVSEVRSGRRHTLGIIFHDAVN